MNEYRKSSTWTRIGILLAVLVALILLPGIIGSIRDSFTEMPLPPDQGLVDVHGEHRYRLIDQTNDDRVDCVLRVPAWPWARTGFYREQPTDRCGGSRFRQMPPEMVRLADEALALRRRAGLSLAVLRDIDDDGRVDCVEFDGTWRYVDGVLCPAAVRSDAATLDQAQRDAADRLLVIERELRSRWLDAPDSESSSTP